MQLRTLPLLPLLILILPLAIALLQWHSIPFWQAQVGFWPGLGWSVLLEMISLWLWFRPGRRWWRPLAWATTALLLAGPLYQVSDPLVREIVALRQADGAFAAQIAAIQAEVAETGRSLDRYQRLSLGGRFGWQGHIDQAQVTLAARRVDMETLRAARTEAETAARLNWRRVGKVGGQLLSLVIFQAAILLAIRTLADAVHRPANGAQTPAAAPQPAADPAERLVAELQKAVQSLLNSGQSYAHIAEETGVGKAHLSLLMNHFDRAKRGDRVLRETALKRLALQLGASNNQPCRGRRPPPE
jgi:hypothetical protein